MNITDRARDALTAVLAEKNAPGIRLYFAGYGWGGPNFGVSLEEPQENDQVQVINHIQVAFEQELEEYTEDLSLDFDENYRSFALLGGGSC